MNWYGGVGGGAAGIRRTQRRRAMLLLSGPQQPAGMREHFGDWR